MRYGPVLEVGDVLTLPTSEGEVDATVLDADVEAEDAEEPGAFRVQLENGEEQVISYALFGGKMRQVFGLWWHL